MSVFLTADINPASDMIVGYIDRIEGYKEVSICDANDYASKNPGTTFLFLDKDKVLKYLNINQANALADTSIKPDSECSRPINDEIPCGTPSIEIYGGGGIGAAANPVIGTDGAILAVDVVRGGNGYQFAPEAEAVENCNVASKASLRAYIDEPPLADEWETYGTESDFEEYEICTPDDVNYGKVFDKNGVEIGTWDPKLYTNITSDPIAAEIQKYTEIIRKVSNKPFWATRTYRPDVISSTDDNLKLYDAVPVSFGSAWSDFMNTYAISPTPPSENFGSDYAGVRFFFEWDQEFPLTGEYVFKGACDDVGVLFLDDERVDNLGPFNGSPKEIRKRVEYGIHRIRLELVNSKPVQDIETEYVDIPFEVYGEGRSDENVKKFKFSFVSQDGKDSFTVENVKRSRNFETKTVRVRKNTNYKVLASTSLSGRVEQGLVKGGTKDREGGLGTSNKIFADRIGSDNDNDDIQITARVGEFKSTNKRKINGRTTFDLTFKVTETQIANKPSKAVSVSGNAWNNNPMGIALTIDAPEPPAPVELIPPQKNRCPNNPIWSTRFAGSQSWYPVNYPAPRTVTEIIQAPKAASDKVLVEFSIFGNTIKGLSDDLSFTFTARDGSDTFSVGGVLKNGLNRVDKLYIKPNVDYVVKAREDTNRFKCVEQGLIKDGRKDKEQGIGSGTRIFADYVGTNNDNNDIQILAGAGTFTSSNKRRTSCGRNTYNLTYKYTPGSSSTGLGAETKTYEIPGWSRFMNRYAISPVKPLTTPGSDSAGINFSNNWTVNLPYDGFYGVQGTSDNTGTITIDGSNSFQLDGFNNESPKINKVFLTKGSHTIQTTIYNEPVETPDVIDQKIFRTSDWINPVPADAPKTVNVKFKVTTRASKTNTIDIDGLFTVSKAKTITKTVEVGKEYTVTVVTANKSEFTNKKKEVKKLDKFDVNVAAALFGGDKYNVKLRKSKENGNILEVEDSRDNDFNDLVCTASEGRFLQIKGNVCKFKVDGTPKIPGGGLVGGTSRDGVTYSGPNVFHHTWTEWGDFMNSQSLSPYLPPLNAKNKAINETRTYIWSNVNFPEAGQYRFKFQADNFATLFINDVQILTTSTPAEVDPTWQYLTISGGLSTIKVVVENYPARFDVFNDNPTGFALEIRRDIVNQVTNKTPWSSNPIGISAILIPPPCPQKISGRGVVTKIIPIYGGVYPVLPPTTITPTPTTTPFPTPTPTVGTPVGPPTPTPTETVPTPIPEPEAPEPPTPIGGPATPTDVPTPTLPTPTTPTPTVATPVGVPTPTPIGTLTPTGAPTPTGTPTIPTPADGTPSPTPTPTIIGFPFPTPVSGRDPEPPRVPTPTPLTPSGTPTPSPTPTSIGLVDTPPTPTAVTPTPSGIPAPIPTAVTPTPSGIPAPIPTAVTPTPSGIPTPTLLTPTPSGIPTPTLLTPTPSGIPTQVGGTPTPSGIPTQVGGTPTPSGIPTPISVTPTPTIPTQTLLTPTQAIAAPTQGTPTPSGVPTFIPTPTPPTPTAPAAPPPSVETRYEVTLRTTPPIVTSPGINYSPNDKVKFVPNLGTEAELVLGPFGSIQEIKIIKPGIGFTRLPDIVVETETGVNFEAVPTFEVIRDPLITADRLIQVTDLVGLKQTGYVNGRAYYGSVFYKEGLKYAGVYETAGELVRVYDTLQESITGIVTTEPSAIQRQGTDVTNNDPRLNIPGTPENLI